MSQIVIDGLVTELSHSGGALDDSWTAARDDAADVNVDTQGIASATKTTVASPPPTYVWKITRSMMQFDTSVLAGKTITAVAIEVFARPNETSDPKDATVEFVDKGTVTGPYPFQLADYALIGNTSFGSLSIGAGTYPDGLWMATDLSNSFISEINTNGITLLGAREIHDYADDEPDPEAEGVATHRFFWFQDDESTCCRLIVTVEDVPPPPTPTGPITRTLYADWTGAAPVANRNWCPEWTTPATSMAHSRRSDGSLAILFGTCDGTGRILRLDSSERNDDGEAIDSFYQTAFAGGPSGRNTFQYMTASVQGNGELGMTAVSPDGAIPLNSRNLVLRPSGDYEWSGLRINGERIAYRFGTNEVDGWYKMRKLVAYGRPSPWSRTRGNAQ